MKKALVFILLLILPISFISCKKTSIKQEKIELSAAGATFPAVLYQKWFDEYYKEKNIQVNFQAIGSGGGIQQLIQKTVDFGATDVPLSQNEEEKTSVKVLHIPVASGAIVVSYNLTDNPKLKLNSEIIAEIFLGKITNWQDVKIKDLNSEINLPDQPISVIHRSDGSGTTSAFTEYLTVNNKEWAEKVGKGKSIDWPIGLGGKGNDGVAGLIMQIPGSIGYIEFIYATQNNLPYGIIENLSGNYIDPSLESVKEAANIELPDDLKVSIINTTSLNGYPISTFTWLIVYQELNYNNNTKAKAKGIVDLLWWTIHEAQEYNEGLSYGKLPESGVIKAENLIKSMTFNGEPILK